MTTMNISLPEDMTAFIETQLAEEGYASASEYLRTLIRDAQKRKAKAELDIMLLEGLEDPLPMSAVTPQFWSDIEREALDGLSNDEIHS